MREEGVLVRWRIWLVLCLVVGWSGGSWAAKGRGAYKFESLPLLRDGLRLLQGKYIDPTQFSSRKMYFAALFAWERALDGFAVQVEKDKKHVLLRLGPEKKRVPVGTFLSLLDVWLNLRPVAAFVERHYRGGKSLRALERLAVKGVFQTLDRQTTVVGSAGLMRRGRGVSRGKLGVMLKWDKGKLWLKRVLLDGPAQLAGLRGGDRIVGIEGEQVKGKGLRHWVGKLGGLRGTRVALEVERQVKGKARRWRVVLRRALWREPDVQGYLLPGRIGVVRLRQFRGGASLWVREELARLRRAAGGSLLGLVFDLRDNPGGRISEAVAIASLFLDKGVVVTYAGANTKRREHKVRAGHTEENYPMALLLSGYSASASELLAGALQKHQRALILGRQSYGKGTVQVVGALPRHRVLYRVTIAQYLLPGDDSIQAVGIVPDVELLPVEVSDQRMRYRGHALYELATRRRRWPRFLQQNLSAAKKKGVRRLYYLAQGSKIQRGKHKAPNAAGGKGKRAQRGKRARHTGTPPLLAAGKRGLGKQKPASGGAKGWLYGKGPAGDDFAVWFARYVLVRARSGRRQELLVGAKRALQEVGLLQEKAIIAALGKLGVDWRASKARGKKKAKREKGAKAPKLSLDVGLVGARLPLLAGASFRLRIKLKNLSARGLRRVRVMITAGAKPFRHQEFLFGALRKGQSRHVERVFRLKPSVLAGASLLRFALFVGEQKLAEETTFRITWRAARRVRYAVAYQLLDPAPDGNGDGRLQRGERVRLRLSITNVGRDPSQALSVGLRAVGVSLHKGASRLGVLKPGVRRVVEFTMRLPDVAKLGPLSAHLVLMDRRLGLRVTYALPLRVVAPFVGFTKSTGGYGHFRKDGLLRESPDEKGRVVAKAKAGTRLLLLRRFGNFVKVRLPRGLYGRDPSKCRAKKHGACATLVPASAWVHEKKIEVLAGKAGGGGGVRLQMAIWPPAIRLVGASTPLEATQAQSDLRLEVDSRHGIKDIYVLHARRKVFYKPVQFTHPTGRKKLRVRVPLRLQRGANTIRVSVRTAKGRFHRRWRLHYFGKKVQHRSLRLWKGLKKR